MIRKVALIGFIAMLGTALFFIVFVLLKINDTMNRRTGGVTWKVTQGDKTELFKHCDEIYFAGCTHCERDNGAEVRICGDYTVEKLKTNQGKGD